MFIGHFGAAFAAKKIDQKPSLGTMFIASQLVDLLWPIFIIFGIEKVKIESGNTAFTPLNFVYYPFTHSLLGDLFWAALFGAGYYLFKRNLKSSVLLSALVLSHWILDFITHRSDLQIVPWNDFKIGLGMWNSVPLTIIVEVLIFAGGTYLYMKVTKAKNKIGSVGLWSLLLFFVVVYFMNIFGPPPPSAEAIGYVGLSMWIFVIWAYWIDKNRVKSVE